MIVKLLVLFLAPFIAGIAVNFAPNALRSNFRLLLIFAGSYLFSITVIHILPELFTGHPAAWVGILVLAGFFLQQILEYLTAGIEHGHIHQGTDSPHHHSHSHSHSHRAIPSYILLLALCIHAFLEGGMLAETKEKLYDLNAILTGIALHRAPAAFALMTVLVAQLGSFRKGIPHLLIFALAAPAGLLLSSLLNEFNLVNSTFMIGLYALVSGNFLHISTTIVVEASPEHEFSSRSLFSALAGATAAIAVGLLV